MKYLHTMIRVSDPDATIELFHAGPALPPTEPWASMPNIGHW